jgi:hypothetical protein
MHLRANVGIVRQVVHDSLLPDPSKFIHRPIIPRYVVFDTESPWSNALKAKTMMRPHLRIRWTLPTSTNPQLSDSNMSGLGPQVVIWQTGRLTSSRNITLTLTLWVRQLVQLGTQSRIDSWSWMLAAGSQSSPGARSWREYRLKLTVRLWGWRMIVSTLRGRELGSIETSAVGSHYRATWLSTLVCVW